MSYQDVRWQDDAACLGMDTNLFFKKNPPREVEKACESCRVSDACLSDALKYDDQYGFRAGRQINLGVPSGRKRA